MKLYDLITTAIKAQSCDNFDETLEPWEQCVYILYVKHECPKLDSNPHIRNFTLKNLYYIAYDGSDDDYIFDTLELELSLEGVKKNVEILREFWIRKTAELSNENSLSIPRK